MDRKFIIFVTASASVHLAAFVLGGSQIEPPQTDIERTQMSIEVSFVTPRPPMPSDPVELPLEEPVEPPVEEPVIEPLPEPEPEPVVEPAPVEPVVEQMPEPAPQVEPSPVTPQPPKPVEQPDPVVSKPPVPSKPVTSSPPPLPPSVSSQGSRMEAPPKPLPRNKPPEYPRVAQDRGYEGTVDLLVQVAADGKVTSVKIARSSGYVILDREAVKAVRRWVYQPATLHGRPVPYTCEQSIRFYIAEMQRSRS